MAADLRQFLERGLIAARRAGPLRRTGKFLRRHPLATVTGVALLLVAGLAGIAWTAAERQSRETALRAFADAILEHGRPIHLLVNNAGVMLPDRRETRDGFEAHFGINHLGHFLLTVRLLDRIRASAPARIVNLSSEAMHFASLTPELSDLDWKLRRYSGWRSYGDSKLMNLMFTNELNRRLEGCGVRAVALHPGIVMTELARDQSFWMHLVGVLARPFSKAVDRGAATTLYAALRADPYRPGESYLADCAPARCGKLAGNREAEARLWALSEELTGL